jgi:catalase
MPDTPAEANPRGLAIRFNLAEHRQTDLVCHSTDRLPTRDGNEFLEFFRAVAASVPDVPWPVDHPRCRGFGIRSERFLADLHFVLS